MVSAPKVLLVVLTVVTLWCSALLYLHVNVAVEPKVHVFRGCPGGTFTHYGHVFQAGGGGLLLLLLLLRDQNNNIML